MSVVRGFWQHENGKIYAVESDSFGAITGGVGPLDTSNLKALDDYDYKRVIVDWLEDALTQGKLHRLQTK